MASSPEFVQYVADQLSAAGIITYRKMFGEYALYCNGKIFALLTWSWCLFPDMKKRSFFLLRMWTTRNF